MPRKQIVDWDEQPLGEVPDVEIARRLGVHYSSVQAQRRKRGIPACNYHNNPNRRWKEGKTLEEWQAEYRELTKDWDWTKTDYELAKEHRGKNGRKLSSTRVQYIRRRILFYPSSKRLAQLRRVNPGKDVNELIQEYSEIELHLTRLRLAEQTAGWDWRLPNEKIAEHFSLRKTKGKGRRKKLDPTFVAWVRKVLGIEPKTSLINQETTPQEIEQELLEKRKRRRRKRKTTHK